MASFKALKDSLTLLSGVNVVGNLKLKSVVTEQLPNPRTLKNFYTACTLCVPLVLYKQNNKAWISSLLRPAAQKIIPFKVLLLIDNVPTVIQEF